MREGKGALKVVGIVVLVIVVIIAAIGIYVWMKLSKINVEKLDKDSLSVNSNLLDDLNKNLDGNLTKSEFDKVINIVLFGSDSRDMSNIGAGRSDTIMICSINPNTKKINLVSIPRDTYVNVEGYGKTKINHAYAYGKEALSIKTINSNFNMNLTEYVTINFEGLKNVIDRVGGIYLNLSNEEMQYVNSHCTNKLTSSGNVLLNGEQALAHSRNRTIGNDFTRANRQRNVIQALMIKISSLSMNEILDLSDDILSQVKTNINVTSYVGILSEILKEKDVYLKNIYSTQVPKEEYASGQMIDGIYYFVSDMEKSRSDLYNIIYGK